MPFIDSLRPFFVGNSLYNSVIVTALATPLTLLLAIALSTLLQKLTQTRLTQFVLAGILILSLWLIDLWYLPWLGQKLSLQLSEPVHGLVLGAYVGFAWVVAPYCAFVHLLYAHSSSQSVDAEQEPTTLVAQRWQQLLMTTKAAVMLLLCNITVPLLLGGGKPFNSTHTLPSWIFTQAWASGDILNSTSQAILVVFVVGFIGAVTMRLNSLTSKTLRADIGDKGRMKEEGAGRKGAHVTWQKWVILTIPFIYIMIPTLFRLGHWIDGRTPLLLIDLFVSIVALLGLTRSYLSLECRYDCSAT